MRVVFDAAGNVLGRMDYAPFGEELYSGLFLPADRFAQLTRDGEAGQDYAQARMYVPRTGRFTGPDPVYAGLFAPQNWNRYTYGLNNPLRFTDPSGLCPDCPVFRTGVVGDLLDGLRGGGGGDDLILAIPDEEPDNSWTPDAGQLGTPNSGQSGNPVIVNPTQSTEQGQRNERPPTRDSLLETLLKKPWLLGWIFPLAPMSRIVGIGPAGGVAWNPESGNLCVSVGAGASAGNNVSVGPLLVNSGNIDSILNGWSISAAANLPFPPAAGIGWQVITNGSGTAQGLTAGVPGVSVDVTYAVCTNR